jgi:hypothetical protein
MTASALSRNSRAHIEYIKLDGYPTTASPRFPAQIPKAGSELTPFGHWPFVQRINNEGNAARVTTDWVSSFNAV